MAKPIKQKKKQTVSWISKEDKNGWSLGLILGRAKKVIWLHNFRFNSYEEVQVAMREAAISFVTLKAKK